MPFNGKLVAFSKRFADFIHGIQAEGKGRVQAGLYGKMAGEQDLPLEHGLENCSWVKTS